MHWPFAAVLTVSEAIIDFYYPNDKPYAEALKNLVKDPNNIEYQEAFDKVRHERVRQDILQHSGVDIDE